MGKKTINLGISNFNIIPGTLSSYGPTPKKMELETKELFHHHWLTKYGTTIEDRGIYEYENCLASSMDWRHKGSGIGLDKESKRNVSNELAKAFTRWFLYTHEKLTYFAPFEHQGNSTYSSGHRWKRVEDGDLPDFVCGKGASDIRLAEAKGRYRSVSFSNKAFEDFRKQIKRVVLEDAAGNRTSVKGYVSACHWATEETPRTKTKLLVEDPNTDGEPPFHGLYPREIGHRMIALHYVSVLARLMLPAHAEALLQNVPISESIGQILLVWQVSLGPLRGKRFVGGLLPAQGQTACCNYMYWAMGRRSPFLHPPATIFAVEESIFKQVMRVCHSGVDAANNISILEIPENFTSGMTVLRDGTLLAPNSYLRMVDEIQI